MVTYFNDHTFIEHNNLIGITDCTQPVSYDDYRTIFKCRTQRIGDLLLVYHIERISCLIQKQKFWITI